MGISVPTSRNDFIGNGATVAFPFTFQCNGAAQVAVYVDGFAQAQPTQFSVSFAVAPAAGAPQPGTVTFVTAPANGAKVVVIRSIPLTQTYSPLNNAILDIQGAGQAAWDDLCMEVQQMKEKLDRAALLPIYSQTVLGDGSMTEFAGANLMLVANASNNGLAWAPQQTGPATPALGLSDTVWMYQNGITGGWIVVLPDGTLLGTGGSTSQGLQEALNYCAVNGYNLFVQGGAQPNGSARLITCSAPILVPPLRSVKISIEGVHLIFNYLTGDGLTFDSMMEADFEFSGGEIIHGGSDYAVRFHPRTPNYTDPTIGITSSRVFIQSIVTTCPTGALGCVAFDDDTGSIWQNLFSFSEINGAGFAGLGVTIYQASFGVLQNVISIAGIHDVKNACIQIGLSGASSAVIAPNIWHIGELHVLAASSHGVDSYCTGDIMQIATVILESATSTGFYLQTGSARNFWTAGLIVHAAGGATSVTDGGVDNEISHDGHRTSIFYTIPAGATPTLPTTKSAVLLKTSNTGATTIQTMGVGVQGQIITIMANDAHTTIKHNNGASGSFYLQGGVDFDMTGVSAGRNPCLTLYNDGGNWIEISRRTS